MNKKTILKKYFKKVVYDEDQQNEFVDVYFCKKCKRDFNEQSALDHYPCKYKEPNREVILKKAIEKAVKGCICLKN